MSKLIGKAETGTIFALLSCLEAIIPLFAGVFFTTIFNATIDTVPGLCYQVAGGMIIVSVVVFCWVDITNQGKNFNTTLPESGNETNVEKDRSNDAS